MQAGQVEFGKHANTKKKEGARMLSGRSSKPHLRHGGGGREVQVKHTIRSSGTPFSDALKYLNRSQNLQFRA